MQNVNKMKSAFSYFLGFLGVGFAEASEFFLGGAGFAGAAFEGVPETALPGDFAIVLDGDVFEVDFAVAAAGFDLAEAATAGFAEPEVRASGAGLLPAFFSTETDGDGFLTIVALSDLRGSVTAVALIVFFFGGA
jgi:hypothetical protein